jgi:hypothetical protein
LRLSSVGRGSVLITLILAAVAGAVTQGPANQDGLWRFLLLRTLADEDGLPKATLYVGDLGDHTLEAVATFEPGFFVLDAVPNPAWGYLLVAGHTCDTDRDITRFYKVPIGPAGERETLYEDFYRKPDFTNIVPEAEDGLFYICRLYSKRETEEAESRTWTTLYRYTPATGIEELAEIDGNVAVHGGAGEGKLYVSYDEMRPEGRTVVFGYYDLATGKLTDSGFVPPERFWSPGRAPDTPAVPGEGPLDYTLGIEECSTGYAVDYYYREPDEPDKYRNMKVEGGTAGFWFYPDRGAVVLFPDLDVEENGIRVVTRYLGGTYGEPFPLPTDPSRGDIKEQRREYEMLYIE